MQENPNLDPIERAKALIKEKKDQNLIKEELDKQEEKQKLSFLFNKISNLKKELSDLKNTKEGKEKEKDEASIRHQNQTSSMKQALEMLRQNPETSHLLTEDKTKEDLGHNERRELAKEVFGEIQEERRNTKKNKRDATSSIGDISSKEKEIKLELEKILNSPECEKLIESKEEEFRKADMENEKFLNDKDKSKNYNEYREIEKVNKFVKANYNEIMLLENKLKQNLSKLLEVIGNVIINAEASNEYQEISKGKSDDYRVNMRKLKEFFPTIDYLQISASGYDSDRINLPNFYYQKGIFAEIVKDINKTHKLISNLNEKIYKSKGLFSGVGTLKKEREALEKKEKFLDKLYKIIDQCLSDFERFSRNEKIDKLNLSSRKNKNQTLAQAFLSYIGNIGDNIYGLREKNYFPDYKKEMTIDQFFEWAKEENKIPEESRRAFEEKNDLDIKMQKAKEEYELVSGKSADRLRY